MCGRVYSRTRRRVPEMDVSRGARLTGEVVVSVVMLAWVLLRFRETGAPKEET
jgi:hypothetical protein